MRLRGRCKVISLRRTNLLSWLAGATLLVMVVVEVWLALAYRRLVATRHAASWLWRALQTESQMERALEGECMAGIGGYSTREASQFASFYLVLIFYGSDCEVCVGRALSLAEEVAALVPADVVRILVATDAEGEQLYFPVRDSSEYILRHVQAGFVREFLDSHPKLVTPVALLVDSKRDRILWARIYAFRWADPLDFATTIAKLCVPCAGGADTGGG